MEESLITQAQQLRQDEVEYEKLKKEFDKEFSFGLTLLVLPMVLGPILPALLYVFFGLGIAGAALLVTSEQNKMKRKILEGRISVHKSLTEGRAMTEEDRIAEDELAEKINKLEEQLLSEKK